MNRKLMPLPFFVGGRYNGTNVPAHLLGFDSISSTEINTGKVIAAYNRTLFWRPDDTSFVFYKHVGSDLDSTCIAVRDILRRFV